MSLIFVGLSILGSLYYTKYMSLNKIEFFECGFESTSPITQGSTNQIIAVAMFMLVYDVELVLLLPVLFFLNTGVYVISTALTLILLMVILSCVWDTYSDAIHYNR